MNTTSIPLSDDGSGDSPGVDEVPRATMNILENLVAEKIRMKERRHALLNTLEEFDAEMTPPDLDRQAET